MKKDTLETRSRNTLLNFIKGCGCFGLIFAHVLFPGDFGIFVREITSQYIVQIFFMISGFYSYSKTPNTAAIRRRLLKTVKLTTISIAIYLLYTIIFKIKYGILNVWLEQFKYLRTWFEIIVLNNFEVIGAFHLWFFPALIVAYIVLILIIKNDCMHLAYKLIPLLFLFKIVVSTVVLTNDYSWHYSTNAWVYPLPWVLVGYYIADNRDKISKISSSIALCFAAMGVIVDVYFILGETPINLAEIGKIMYSLGLFVVAINNPTVSISRIIEKIGDDYYLYVYIIHLMVIDLLEKVAFKFGMSESNEYIWLKPLLVFIISLLASTQIKYFLRKLKNSKRTEIVR